MKRLGCHFSMRQIHKTLSATAYAISYGCKQDYIKTVEIEVAKQRRMTKKKRLSADAVHNIRMKLKYWLLFHFVGRILRGYGFYIGEDL